MEHHCAFDWFARVLVNVYSRHPSRRVCFNPPHDGIIKAEGLHFREKKSAADGVKGIDKIQGNGNNRVTFINYSRNRFLEDQEIG